MKRISPTRAVLAIMLMGSFILTFPCFARVNKGYHLDKRQFEPQRKKRFSSPIVSWWEQLPVQSLRPPGPSTQELLEKWLKPLLKTSYLDRPHRSIRSVVKPKAQPKKQLHKKQPSKKQYSKKVPVQRPALKQVFVENKRALLKDKADHLVSGVRSKPLSVQQLMSLVERELAIIAQVIKKAGSIPTADAVQKRNQLLATSLVIVGRAYNALMDYATYHPNLTQDRSGIKFYLRSVQHILEDYYKILCGFLN